MKLRLLKNDRTVYAGILICLFLILAALGPVRAQNHVLILGDNPHAIGDTAIIDSIFHQLSYIPRYSSTIPAELDVHDYSLVLLPEYSGINCGIFKDYLLEGGCLILSGRAPMDLLLTCAPYDSAEEWIGFGRYMNGSGELVACVDLKQISLPRDSLLDRTPCNLGFGGLKLRLNEALVLARWICPGHTDSVAAITQNEYGRGRVFYFSRALPTIRLRALFAWALAAGIEYRWGDADNSGQVNVTDAVYILRMIFDFGPDPPILNSADVNADGSINVSDAAWLINYIFSYGPAPLAGRVE